MNNLSKNIVLLFLIAIMALPAFAAYEPTNLSVKDSTTTSITWQWTPNSTYYNTSVEIDGTFKANVTSPTSGTQQYQATGFTRQSSHTISIRSYNATNYSGYSVYVNMTNTTDGMFDGIVDVIDATVNLMPSIVNLVVGIVPVLVTLAVVGLITGIFSAIVMAIKGGL